MNLGELDFHRPAELQAVAPPEQRGLGRDGVRLMLTNENGNSHYRFRDLPELLRAGDLLVVNESATLPASLPAVAPFGGFLLNLSTAYGNGVWLAEPRWSASVPGPLPLVPGSRFQVGRTPVRVIATYPEIPRLLFVQSEENLLEVGRRLGRPIRYGYLRAEFPLEAYQTYFARIPGSAEMPSAGRPFTQAIVERLESRGVRRVGILLHSGVSSLELSENGSPTSVSYPEPFEVSQDAADAVNRTHQDGGRVIAVGTTVVRALESAWDGCTVRRAQGFTRLWLHPGTGPKVIDGLLSGFHDPRSSHLALLHSFAGAARIQGAYREAVNSGYLWHEFGDSHLLVRN